MKRIIIGLSLIVSLISFYVVVVVHGMNFGKWMLTSFSPYMFIGAVALFLKRKMVQCFVLPFLIYYGMYMIFGVGWSLDYSFAYISAIVMLALAAYVILAQILKFRIIRFIIGLLVGVVLFIGVYIARNELTTRQEREEISEIEYGILR